MSAVSEPTTSPSALVGGKAELLARELLTLLWIRSDSMPLCSLFRMHVQNIQRDSTSPRLARSSHDEAEKRTRPVTD